MTEPTETREPSSQAVYRYLIYGASIPERALRATTAAVSGAVRESAGWLVPQAFRSSRSYTIFVQQMLDFLAHDVGGVQRAATTEAPEVESFVARKTVGSFLELAGLATLHLSPITVLAIVSDVAYGSREYLRELSDELKKQGVIDESSTIHNASDLLEAVSKASGDTVESLDLPPLTVEGLRETINQSRQALSQIDLRRAIPKAELDRLWGELHAVAQRENVSMLEASSAIALLTINRIGSVGRGALSGVRVVGNMFDRHILDHYSTGLETLRTQGFYATLAKASGPYLAAVWQNFSAHRTTWTEDLLSGRWFQRLGAAWRSWRRPRVAPEEGSRGDAEPQ